jgi:hypothetical protein
MIRTGWLAAFLLTVAPWTCLGQMGGMGGMGGGLGGWGGMQQQKPPEHWTVKAETFGSQAVTGKLRLDAVVVKCELGTYEIKPDKIKTIEFAATEPGSPMIVGMHGAERKGSVITSTGETVSGTVSIPNTWRIETDLGFLTPDAQQLKTFTFVAKVAAASQPSIREPGRVRTGDSPVGDPSKPKPGERPDGSKGGQPDNSGKPNPPGDSNGAKKPGEPEKTS